MRTPRLTSKLALRSKPASRRWVISRGMLTLKKRARVEGRQDPERAVSLRTKS